MDWSEPHIVELPKVYDVRGSLSFAQSDLSLPFAIERVFWIYDVPAGAERGSHAHRRMQELMIAASGSFTVELRTAKKDYRFTLNRPSQGLYIPPGCWRTMNNFSSGSICLALASTLYDESDYIRDYDVFLEEFGQKK